MDDLVDVGEIDAFASSDQFDAVEDGPVGSVVGREQLDGGIRAVGPFEHDVGERAAHVGADPHAHGYRSSSGGNVEGGTMSTVAERCCASIPPSTLITSPVT